MKWFLLPFLIALSGCATLGNEEKTDQATESVFYKRDIKIIHNEKTYTGTAVLPKQDSYSVTVKSPGKMDLFTWTDCHMEHTQEDAGKGGWFGKKPEIDFDYFREFSKDTYCPVEVGAYEAIKGRHSWGFIDFESDEETLPAKVFCNGYVTNAKGVSVCQSKKGLSQKVVFPVPADTDMEDEKCPMPISMDSRTYEFPMVPGRCVYVFREFEGERRFHRLTTLGYDKILIREVQP